MTAAEKLTQRVREESLQEGRQEGRKEGQVEVLLRLLSLRFGKLPAPVVQRMQEAADAELAGWTERVLTAPSLDAVFADELP